uniref:Uncharacterized protein n=1 Tax=Molossus molossus TaxID=27622 RepID=A0A7J8HCV0_MOLMO|nr:hypothetical protein HJG59_011106 [Molossus molossus]
MEGLAGVAQWLSIDPAPRGRRFESRSGHMPRLWAGSPVGDMQVAAIQCSRSSMSLSLSLTLSLKSILKKRYIYIYICKKKTKWRFLKYLKIQLPYDLALPVLGIYLKKIKIYLKKTNSKIYIVP